MAELHRRCHLQLKAWGAYLLLIAPLCSPAAVVAVQRETAPVIVVNPGRYAPYYHLRFDLTGAAIDFSRTNRSPRDGGQFTIRLRSARFPVPAPSCRGGLILRMPWTPPGSPEAGRKVAAKRALLNQILALEHNADAALPVVLELNPYARVTSRSPLTLQLTQCNVFFRQVLGAYVDDTEARPGR